MATSRPTIFGTWYNDLQRQLYSSPLGSLGGGDWGRPRAGGSIAKFRASNQLAGGVVSYGRPRPRSPRPGYAVRPPLPRRPTRPPPSSGWFGNDPLTTHNISQISDEVGIPGVGPALAADKFISALPLPAQIALTPLFLGPQTITSIAGKAGDIAGDVGSFVGGLFGGGPPAPSPTYYAGDTSAGGGSGHARERVF